MTTYAKQIGKAVRTSTNNLQVGDVVQHGNCISGFYYATIAKIDSTSSKMALRIFQDYGSNVDSIGSVYGKNGIWYVVKVGA